MLRNDPEFLSLVNLAQSTGHTLFEMAPGLFGDRLGVKELTVWILHQEIEKEEKEKREKEDRDKN